MSERDSESADSDHEVETDGSGSVDATTETGTERTQSPGDASEQESVGDILSRPDVKHQVKYAVGLFAVVGVGFGLTGFVFTDILIPGIAGASGDSTSGALLGGLLTVFSLLSILVVAALSGPILGVTTALRVEKVFEADRVAYVTSAVGTAAGYVAMLLITVLVLSLTGSTSGGGSTGSSTGGLVNLGDLIVPIIALAIPVGIVGAATVYVHRALE